ncbi:hypothetical protein NPIL_124501 [Nephila pilipes]|uniref:Uncharacterized protein n=1 Tax=Nephila pilipes TaxID=299642 RepID=A0A8X6PU58_NEPPI|nr:hypothetical protein NPIL_124501 [Nephila pilipes]
MRRAFRRHLVAIAATANAQAAMQDVTHRTAFGTLPHGISLPARRIWTHRPTWFFSRPRMDKITRMRPHACAWHAHSASHRRYPHARISRSRHKCRNLRSQMNVISRGI